MFAFPEAAGVLGEGRSQAVHQASLHRGCGEIAQGDSGDPLTPCPFTITEEGLASVCREEPGPSHGSVRV